MKSDLVDIACVIRRETDKAVCIDHGGKETAWLPKSQIEVEPNSDGKTVTVSMPQWLAEEKRIV